MELKLVGPDGNRVPHGGIAPGDLWVRGAWAAKGYFRDSGDRLDAEGYFPTGDVAVVDELGYMRITDRTKDVIKSGGEWISSVDVENIVYTHPAVKLAAVVGVRHSKWEERPVLIITLKQGASCTEQEMLEYLRPRMARWWLPDRVFIAPGAAHDGNRQDPQARPAELTQRRFVRERRDRVVLWRTFCRRTEMS